METIEGLSKDILEENFVRTDRSIYRLQFLLGCNRTVIKNRFATPPTLLQKCYTIIYLIFLTGTTVFVSEHGTQEINHKSVKLLAVAILIIIYIVSTCNIIHARFMNGSRNAAFTVRMQRLDRQMKLEDKNVYGILERINNVSTVILVLACGSQIRVIAYIGTTLCALTVVLELLACSSVLCYFIIRILYVNHQIRRFLNQEGNVRKPVILDSSVIWMNFLNDKDDNFDTSNMHIYLKEIFDLFVEFQELYKFQFLLFCMKLVVLNLMTFELTFYAVRNSFEIAGLQVFILYSLIDIALAVFTAHRFHKFHSEVKEMKRSCISVMSIHFDGPVREKARCMLSLIEESPPRFSVYDMWHIDGRVFVTIFGLVTGLMVSLTQFSFL